jgi:hypothetical protein
MATTTPNYGWPVPTSTDYVKDGATAIEALGDAIDATVFGLGSSALVLIKQQTIGTAVSSVTVTNAFSADYDTYLITVSGGTASVNDSDIRFLLGASTTGYYYKYIYFNYSAGVSNEFGNNTTGFDYSGSADTNGLNASIEVRNPFTTQHTTIRADKIGPSYAGWEGGVHKVATSYTDFVIKANAAVTYTGGTIRVYGYAKA